MGAPSSHTTLSGQTLAGRYRIEHLLGRGGFADVYLAHHLEIESLRVAIKVLHGTHLGRSGILERFKREASLLAMLRNRHTVRLIDFGFTDTEAPFLVMEYVEGAPLNEVIRASGRLRDTDAARLGIHVLKALVEAHELGIVHRDLKPANVLLIREPGERHPVARVLDFGIAKVMGDPQVKVAAEQMSRLSHAHTRTDQVFCTPLYASPELLLGAPDFRTDLYALGLVLAEMLDGKPPYVDVDCNLNNSPHLLSAPVPLGPITEASALGPVIRQAVAKRLDERFQTATEMLDALQDVYARIRLPARTEVPLDVLTPPPVDDGVIELRASQFIPLLDESTNAIPLSELYTQLAPKLPELTPKLPELTPKLPELTPEAPEISGFNAPLERTTHIAATASPQVRTRRRIAGIALVGAAALTLSLVVLARQQSSPVESSASAATPPPELLAPPTPIPVAIEPPSDAPAPLVPLSAAVAAARTHVNNATWDAPSALIRVRANTKARLLVNGENIAELIRDDQGWHLPPNVAIPMTRPVQISLVSAGVVYTHEVIDYGPVDLSIDLLAMGEQATENGESAESGAENAEQTRRRSSRRRARASSEGSEGSSSILGPSIAPRTQ